MAVSRHSGQAGTGLGEQSGASLLRWSSHPETSLFGRGPWPRPSGSPAMKARLLAAGRALRLAAGIIGASHTSRAIGTGSHAFTVLGRGLSAPGGARGRYPIRVGLRHRAVARIRVVGGFRAVVVLQGGDSLGCFWATAARPVCGLTATAVPVRGTDAYGFGTGLTPGG